MLDLWASGTVLSILKRGNHKCEDIFFKATIALKPIIIVTLEEAEQIVTD